MLNLTRSAALVIAALALSFSATAVFADNDDDDDYDCDVEPVVESIAGPGAKGKGRLCVLSDRLKGKLRIKNLVPGNAYTVWWTYQDDPGLCLGTGTPDFIGSLTGGVSRCELSDFEGDKPLGVFGRMASGVAPRNGRLSFRGTLGGMQPSSGSEVWFWLFNHGPAIYTNGAALARQLLTPEDPNAGAPHLGNFIDCPEPVPGNQCGAPAATVVFAID